MANITHYLVIKAPTEKVYQAVTEHDGLTQWWTAKTIAEPEIGFTNEFFFSNDYHNKMLVTELEPKKLVHWQCIGGDREWIGTSLSFQLTEGDGKTELMFTHADWKDQTLFFANCNYQWGRFMESLKNYCETGKGNPYRDT
jgi:uncharacterized protein YndB with AHSA1/START domain